MLHHYLYENHLILIHDAESHLILIQDAYLSEQFCDKYPMLISPTNWRVTAQVSPER